MPPGASFADDGDAVRRRRECNACGERFTTLEHALLHAFPDGEVRRLVPCAVSESLAYQVRFSLPGTLDEARGALRAMRRGLFALMARFEPERFHAVGDVTATFGERETLASLSGRDPKVRPVRIMAPAASSTSVH